MTSLPASVRRLAHALAPALEGIDAADLEQEAAIAIWRADPDTDGLAAVIGRRRIIDVARQVSGRRRQKARPVQLQSWHDERPDPCPTYVQLREVLEDVQHLPDREVAILLADWHGLTLDQTGAAYGISGSRASQIRSATRAALRARHG